MTAIASRLPCGFAPLIAEAKRRMVRRRSLAGLLLVLVCLGIGLSSVFHFRPGGTGAGRPVASSLRAGKLTVSVPHGLHSYPFRGGIYRTGTRPPVIGRLLTDVRLPDHVNAWKAFDQWGAAGGAGPPANGVALVLVVRGMGPVAAQALHLPLTLEQPLWAREKLNGGAVGYRYGDLRAGDGDYTVMYWSGPDAPARDRAAILQALRSIRPAR